MAKVPPLPPGTTMSDLINHRNSKAFRQVARILNTGAEVSTTDLAGMVDVTLTSIWTAIRAMRDAELIYVVRWLKFEGKNTNPQAVYKMGNRSDAPKPPPLPTTQRRTVNREKKIKQVEEVKVDPTVYQELAQALVPQRTPEQVAEINRLYLNWISEGTYG